MGPELTAFKTCERIQQQVRFSQLNFNIQETPFSIFLTLRKSYNKNFVNSVEVDSVESHPHSGIVNLTQLEIRNHNLQANLKKMEKDNTALYNDYVEEVTISEALKCELESTKVQFNNLDTHFDSMEKKLKTHTTEKESIEKRFEMICAEVKTVKQSNEDLKKEIKHISADLKNSIS